MIDYNDTGRGNPLVLIHGFCEDKTIWEQTEEFLSETYRVISVDLPGFGNSREYPDEPTIEFYAKQLHELLEGLSIQKPVLIGHSLGGYISLAYAEEYEVAGIALINSTAFADTEEKIRSRNKVIEFIDKRGVELFLKSFVKPLFASQNQESCADDISKLIESGKLINPHAMQGCVAAMRDRKSRIDVVINSNFPILYIIGKEDSIVSYQSSMDQLEKAPNADKLILENVGHMAMIEKPLETNNALQNFCDKCFATH